MKLQCRNHFDEHDTFYVETFRSGVSLIDRRRGKPRGGPADLDATKAKWRSETNISAPVCFIANVTQRAFHASTRALIAMHNRRDKRRSHALRNRRHWGALTEECPIPQCSERCNLHRMIETLRTAPVFAGMKLLLDNAGTAAVGRLTSKLDKKWEGAHRIRFGSPITVSLRFDQSIFNILMPPPHSAYHQYHL